MSRIYERIAKLYHMLPELRALPDKVLSELEKKLEKRDQKYEKELSYSKNRRKNSLYTF